MKRHLITYLGMALVAAAAFGPFGPDATMTLTTFGVALFGAGTGAPRTTAKDWHLARPRGLDAAIDRYLASDAEDADAILEADLDAVLRPAHADPAAIARNASLYTTEEIKALAERRKAEARRWQAPRDTPTPPMRERTYIVNGRHEVEVRYEPVYADQSPDPVDFVEVPCA